MHGEHGADHLSLKKQWQLLQTLYRAKQAGQWDQQAASKLGSYMANHGIRSMALRGYFAELTDGGLYVDEVPVEEYGLAAYLHYEYISEDQSSDGQQAQGSRARS